MTEKVESSSGPLHGHYAESDSGSEWATPGYIWRPLADALGGFDLDPASGAEPSPIADARFTKADNGLARDWFGDVWVNPPYGRSENPTWAKKISAEAKQDAVDTVTALIPSAPGAKWYQDYYGTGDIQTHIRGRVEFIGAKEDGATFWSDIITFGDVPDEYIEALWDLGQVRPIPCSGSEQTTLGELEL